MYPGDEPLVSQLDEHMSLKAEAIEATRGAVDFDLPADPSFPVLVSDRLDLG